MRIILMLVLLFVSSNIYAEDYKYILDMPWGAGYGEVSSFMKKNNFSLVKHKNDFYSFECIDRNMECYIEFKDNVIDSLIFRYYPIDDEFYSLFDEILQVLVSNFGMPTNFGMPSEIKAEPYENANYARNKDEYIKGVKAICILYTFCWENNSDCIIVLNNTGVNISLHIKNPGLKKITLY